MRTGLRLELGLVAVCCFACSRPDGESAKSPVLAKGEGVVVTADQFLSTVADQPPQTRGSFASLEKRKELLDELLDLEVMVAEAKRQGVDRDPEVRRTYQKLLVHRLEQRHRSQPVQLLPADEQELRKRYEAEKEKEQEKRKANGDGAEQLASFDELRPALVAQLVRERREEDLKNYRQTLRQNAKVSVREEELKRLDLGALPPTK